jgi:hypothetical protein
VETAKQLAREHPSDPKIPAPAGAEVAPAAFFFYAVKDWQAEDDGAALFRRFLEFPRRGFGEGGIRY